MNTKLMRALWVLAFTSFGATGAFGNEFPGALKKLENSNRDRLSYECEIQSRTKNIKLQVSIQTANGFMEAELANGIRVKGFASETLDRKTQKTFYFLQGGSAPYGQQLTLVVQDGGNWAEFRLAHGGEFFRCGL